MLRHKRGFSLIEAMIVTTIVAVGSTVALVQLKSTVSTSDADKTANLVVSQLNYARQLAVAQRRNVLVEFLGTNQVKLTRQDIGGGTTVLSDVTLPAGYTFHLPSGTVGDTPDAFGNASAVYINNGTSGIFLGDGTFVSSGNVIQNGSIFTMGPGNGTARAVTIVGATGRLKKYGLQGSSWAVR